MKTILLFRNQEKIALKPFQPGMLSGYTVKMGCVDWFDYCGFGNLGKLWS
jgi:hypothetical protein